MSGRSGLAGLGGLGCLGFSGRTARFEFCWAVSVVGELELVLVLMLVLVEVQSVQGQGRKSETGVFDRSSDGGPWSDGGRLDDSLRSMNQSINNSAEEKRRRKCRSREGETGILRAEGRCAVGEWQLWTRKLKHFCVCFI